MEWFLREWEKGWTEWVNPFNPKQKKIVSFEDTQLVVFWSKYPIGVAENLSRINFDFLLLYTVNDYPELEPNVPNLGKRTELFREISRKIGREKVIWRFDPIIFLNDTSVKDVVEKFRRISRDLEGYTERVITSVMTPYKKVVRRMRKAGFPPREPSEKEIIDLGRNLKEIASNRGMEIQTCADRFWKLFESVSVRKGACIDPEYIKNAFSGNIKLIEGVKKLKKDRGQRSLCGCVESVDIGRYKTCKFNCTYCYAV